MEVVLEIAENKSNCLCALDWWKDAKSFKGLGSGTNNRGESPRTTTYMQTLHEIHEQFRILQQKMEEMQGVSSFLNNYFLFFSHV
ncbi:unnamed protein product [Lupinus luteus]|uniref:Uncharacterized protein n=1 Tax=Lupinus luteus TaxID=3873 RepID=A0AAV1XJ22_LUPLU